VVDDEFAQYDAAYVLGALTPAERYRYEQHLADCPHCRASVDAFTPLPGLLSRVPREELFSEPVEPPAELLPGLLATAARRHRRTRRWLVTAGSAVTAAAAAAVLVVVLALGGGQPADNPGRQMTAAAGAPIHGWVALTAEPWGTEVSLHCRYDGTERYAAGYILVVRGPRSQTERISSWDAVPGTTAVLSGTTAMHRADIRTVQVLTAGGQPVLTLAV
jgi:putative zinc finger protein